MEEIDEQPGMTKHGMLTEESQSDFDNTKKAEYYDAEGFGVADAENKDKLKAPRSVQDLD
ncbi:MAG: hypothetical protein WCL71_03560 [Deltaproteobacteria bacterium]